MEEILLFEGLSSSKGGTKMLGRTCIRTKRVKSPVLGKYVTRCAAYSGDGGLAGLGALPFDIGAVKDTLLTGAVAVGGAFGVRKAGGYLMDALKIDPMSRWKMAIEVGIGLGGGFMIGKYTGKADLGAAVAVGPVVINGMELASEFLAPAGAGIAGAQAPPLGVTVEQEQLPAWTTPNPFIEQVQQQFPAWTVG